MTINKERKRRKTMAKEFKVIPANMKGQMRFIVTDLEGKVIDDMNGYGYKTQTTAYRGHIYKRRCGMI